MERLTLHSITSAFDYAKNHLSQEEAAKVYARLAELEDKIESGQLFELVDIEDTFCCAMIGTTEQGEKYVSLEDYEHDIHKLGKVIKTYRAKLESGQLIELSTDTLINILRCIVFKAKYGRQNIFEPFKGADAFGQPQVQSMDDLLLRTVITLLGIKSREQAEARLQELRGEK